MQEKQAKLSQFSYIICELWGRSIPSDKQQMMTLMEESERHADGQVYGISCLFVP